MSWRGPSLSVLTILLVATSLAACGGSSQRSTSTTTDSLQAKTPKSKNPDGNAKPEDGAGESAPSTAGGATAFIVPGADNSIPKYGVEAPPATIAAANSVLKSYLRARKVGDWATVCARLGATPKRQLSVVAGADGSSDFDCRSGYRELTTNERTDPLSGAIAAFRVKGSRAFALFYGPERHQYMIPMIHEGGSWKVNQVAPLSYPIGVPVAGG